LAIVEQKKKEVKIIQYIFKFLEVYYAYTKGVRVGVILETKVENRQEAADISFLFSDHRPEKEPSEEAKKAASAIYDILGYNLRLKFYQSAEKHYMHKSMIKNTSPSEFAVDLPGGKTVKFDKVHFFDYRDPSSKEAGRYEPVLLLDYLKTRSME